MSEQQVINMRGLLSNGFSHLPEKLPKVPRLLAVTVPPFAHDESDTAFCLNSPDLRSDWGDCTLDLEEHFAEHCVDRSKAKYRLAAYVAYEGDEDVTPTWAFISGHFLAYFSEGGRWYKADDSTAKVLCILERLDLQALMPWPSMCTESRETASSDSEDDENVPLGSKGQDATTSRPACSSDPLILQTPKAARIGN